jgi:hypothetical protein
MSDGPICVNQSAFGGMVAALARDLLKLAGACLVTRGALTADTLDQVAGFVVSATPMIYTQFKTLWNHRKLVTAADAAPDHVAVVKG